MFKMSYLQSLLGLQAETRHASRISGFPQLRQAYYKEGPSGVWRPPIVNETCCRRARLAELLDEVAVSGPDVLYNGSLHQGLALFDLLQTISKTWSQAAVAWKVCS